MRQIVLDTETTGLDASDGHRIVELGAVEIVNRQLTGRNLHCYFNPGRDSDPDALRVHGLTTDFLSDKPGFADETPALLAFVQDAEVIIHNAAFDVGFLDAELKRAGLSDFVSHCAKVTDSLLAARELHPGKRNSLDALCERYGVSNAHRVLHGALLDAELLAEVWLAMTRGQDSLLLSALPDETGEAAAGRALAQARPHDLPVLMPDPEELAQHQAYILALEKESGQPVLWNGGPGDSHDAS